jgi:putative endonuclease
MAYMYMLSCSDGTTSVGSTIDLEPRLAQHQAGEGAEYTRRRLPVAVIHVEEYARIDDAFAREKQVQKWSRAKRLALARGDDVALAAASRKRWV